MKRVVLIAALLLAVASPAAAQIKFTALANLGVGFQNDEYFDQTANGLAGLNFGAGVFLTPDLAVLGRFSGTRVTFDDDVFGGVREQASGVFGGTVQYWLNNWASVEAGVGYGRWRDEFDNKDGGFGLILGFGATVFQRGPHHVRAGFEYAPVFTDSKVHNIGLTIGYQYGR